MIRGCNGTGRIPAAKEGRCLSISYGREAIIKRRGLPRQTFQILLNSDGSIVYQYAGVINDVSTSIGVENQTMPDKG